MFFDLKFKVIIYFSYKMRIVFQREIYCLRMEASVTMENNIISSKLKTKYGKSVGVLLFSIFIVTSFTVNGRALDRIAGYNRFETSVEISKKISSEKTPVILANGRSYIDALSGGSLAAASRGRILLTETDSLPLATMNEILRTKPDKVYILGGKFSVSSGIEEELKFKGYNVVRISGQDRYETSTKIVDEIKLNYGLDEICIVTNQMDAISACAYCGEKKPILLVNKEKPNYDLLDKYSSLEKFAIGGRESISQDLYERLGMNRRIAGENRYETAIEISKLIDGDRVYVASGQNIIDALALGPLAYQDGASIILTNKSGIKRSYKPYINEKYNDISLVGGPNWVPNDLFKSHDKPEIKPDKKPNKDSQEKNIIPKNRSSFEYWDYYNHYDSRVIYSQDQIREINKNNISKSKYLNKLEDIKGQYGFIANRTVMRDRPARIDSSRGQDQGALTGLFPWDELVIVGQNSDKTWSKVYSVDYCGWVPTKNIMKVTKEEFLANRSVDFATFINRQKYTGGYTIDMGTRMPIVSEDSTSFKLAMPIAGNSYRTTSISLDRSEAVKSYLDFSQANIIRQALKFEGESYGWGHSNNTRDCSGFIRDIYRSFGLVVSRDASSQSKDLVGRKIDFASYNSRRAKEDFLLRQKPGISMYMKGHVMMYLGKDSKSRPHMIHQYGYAFVNGRNTAVFRNEINDVARKATSSAAFIDFVTSGRDFTN